MKEYMNKRNPVLPVEYHVPDGEAHVMPDGRLYIYGSFDVQDGEYCSEKYHVVSTSDMEHWVIHEEALNGRDVPWFNDPDAAKYPGLDWMHPTPFIQKMIQKIMAEYQDLENIPEKTEDTEKKPLLFAPDCIWKDGKYYLYFCMNDESEGVAVSDSPVGPFKQIVQLPCGGIDPAVFIDDDGQAYYYWGQVYSRGVKLGDDMISFQGEIVENLVTEEEHFFHEGSSMRKIGDIYYYVFADVERGKPTALGYATGKSPLGPFVYRGIIIDNDGCDPLSWNNHGSIECFNGQWYVFYHRSSRGSEQHRRLCIEPITINPDGSIDEVKMTSQGAGQPFGNGEFIMGYQACEMKGKVFIEPDEHYGEKLTNFSDGDEVTFRYVKSEEAYSEIEFDASGTGTIEVLLDGEIAGTIRIQDGKQIGNKIQKQPGQYEVVLRCSETDKLEIMRLRFCAAV